MEFSVDTVQVLLYGALRKPHFFSNFPVAEPGSGELGYGPLVVCETFRPLGVFCFASGMDEMGPILSKLRETLVDIQEGRIEAPEGWIHVIE